MMHRNKQAFISIHAFLITANLLLAGTPGDSTLRIPPPDASAGGWSDSGPLGAYFASENPAGEPAFTRRDVRIAFDWGTKRQIGGSPAEPYRSFPRSHFAVQWSGRVIPRFSEEYTFTVQTTGKAQLFLNADDETGAKSILLVKRNGTASSNPIRLRAGKSYEILLEYSQETGTAAVELHWSCPSAPDQVIDPVVAQGLNVATWPEYCFADGTKCMGYGWSQKGKLPRDDHGWPQADCNLYLNGDGGQQSLSGTYQISFRGQAEVRFRNEIFTTADRVFTNVLPRGAGYNPTDNLTSATVTFSPKQDDPIRLTQTARDGKDAKGDGVTDIRMMRPLAPGASAPHHPDEIIYRPMKSILASYTCLRWLGIANVGDSGLWADRTLPDWPGFTRRSCFDSNNGGECWEILITMANECGKDLYLCLPMQGDADYFDKIARLVRYGSDGVNPYDHEVENPKWPPLNPNLRLYIEVGNEIWNWGFPSTQYCNSQAKKEVADKTEDGQIINYDGKSNYRRFHAVRTIRASDTFRRIWGDDAMGSRVRFLLEYQYNNYQNTALDSLTFLDAWYNNGDGEHVKDPHPVRYWVWGGGGATYYGVGNSHGYQDTVRLPDPGFEAGTVGDGQEAANPAGSRWACTGPASIYRNYWTSVADFTPGTGKISRAISAAGCTFRVDQPRFLHALGCWMSKWAGSPYTLTLLSPQGAIAQTRVKTQHYKMNTVDGWCWSATTGTPIRLEPGIDYHILAVADNGDLNIAADPVAVEVGPGFTIVGAAQAIFKPKTAPNEWEIKSIKTGAYSFGPVAVQTSSTVETKRTVLYDPFMGGQGGVLRAGGSLSTKVNFPKAGHYGLELHASGPDNKGWPGYVPFSVTVGTNSANPLSQREERLAPTNGVFGIGGWEHRLNQTAEIWGSGVFVVDQPGEYELRIASNNKPNNHTNEWTVFDDIKVTSVDAILDSGFGAGQAYGQVAQNNYARQIYGQASFARSFGLQVIAYEAGWSLGGDMDALPIQGWCKFNEDRATGINDTAESIFLRAGSFMNVWGVYLYCPLHDLAHAASYPLMRSIANISCCLPPEADNGIPLPAQLNATNSVCGRSDFKTNGQWQSWLVIVPSTGTWSLHPQMQGNAPWDLEVDGMRVASGSTHAMPSPTRTIHLVKGLHGVRFRAGGALTLDSITVERTKE